MLKKRTWDFSLEQAALKRLPEMVCIHTLILITYSLSGLKALPQSCASGYGVTLRSLGEEGRCICAQCLQPNCCMPVCFCVCIVGSPGAFHITGRNMSGDRARKMGQVQQLVDPLDVFCVCHFLIDVLQKRPSSAFLLSSLLCFTPPGKGGRGLN